jgi:hypothetical protein
MAIPRELRDERHAAPDGGDPAIQGGPIAARGWDNQTAETIDFDESAKQETCFVWAYDHPSQGPKLFLGKYRSSVAASVYSRMTKRSGSSNEAECAPKCCGPRAHVRRLR